jgi:hypothetical protein
MNYDGDKKAALSVLAVGSFFYFFFGIFVFHKKR